MRRQKIIALLMTAIMSVGLFAGCGKEEVSNNSEQKSSETSKESSEVISSEIEKEELDFVTLKFISIGDPNETSEKVFLEKLNERTRAELNCEVEIQNLSWADYKTQYPLIVSSGEDWDMIYTASWCFYAENASNGTFLEITEEDFQKYMPLTYAQAKDSFNSVKINGKAYMVPQSFPEYNDNTCIGVRGDIMQEVGLDKITTVDELELYLDHTVANHKDLNVINLTQSYTFIPITLAMLDLQQEEGAYSSMNEDYTVGVNRSGFYGPYIIDHTDPANVKLVDEEVADAYNLKLFNKIHDWQKKGYWSEDCLSAQGEIQDYYTAGTGAFVMRQMGNVAGFVKALRNDYPDADAKFFRLTDEPLRKNGGTGNGVAFNSSSENVERAMMVADILNSVEEGMNDLLKWGVEGVHYELDDRGLINQISEPEYKWNVPTSMGFMPAERRYTAGNIDEYYELIEKGRQNFICPDAYMFLFDSTNLSTEVAAVGDVNERYLKILSAGLAEDTESFYYEYKEALKAAGYEELLSAYVEQLQGYLNELN